MSRINWNCEATSQIIDAGLLRLAKGAVSKARRAFAYTVLSFLALCTAKPALADDIPGQLSITHSVSAAGASVASIPIPTLPGAGGLEPKLLLSYSSQDGNTGFGLGWSLNGYSTIVRGSKTRDVDGTPGPIAYQNDDAFYLNGERMVPVAQLSPNDTGGPWWLQAGSIPNGAVEFRKWVDDGTLIIAVLTGGSDPARPTAIDRFIAENKSGIRTEFTWKVGETVLPAPAIYLPSRSIDTAGDYIQWHFNITGLAYQLLSVEYTGLDGQVPIAPFATVQFTYEQAPRTLLSHLLGQVLSKPQRLKTVATTLNGSSGAAATGLLLTLSYKEAPASSGDAYYLTGAQLTALGDNIPGVSFDYKALPASAAWKQIKSVPSGIPAIGGVATPTVAYRLSKSWDGAGNVVPSLFLSKYSNGQFVSKAYIYSSNGWSEIKGLRAPPVPFVDASGNPLNVVLMGINGNDPKDLLQLRDKGQAFIQNQNGWTVDPLHQLSFSSLLFAGSDLPLTLAQPLRLGSYPTPRQDLLVRLATGSYSVLLNKPSGWARPNDPSLNFSLPQGDELAIGDFNGDGLDDRVDMVLNGGSLSLRIYTSKPNSQTWTQETGAAWAWPAPVTGPFHLRAIKIDPSNSCDALLVSIYDTAQHVEKLYILQGSQNGWKQPVPYSGSGGPLFFESDGTPLSPSFVDVNGDGRTDVIMDQIDSHQSNIQQTWIQSAQISGSTVSWIHDDSKYGPPPVLINNASNYIVAPWQGANHGGVIIALPSASQAEGATYLSTATGWQNNTNLGFAPSVSLVTTKQNTGFIQIVDLDSHGLQDVIYNDGQEDPCAAVPNVLDQHCGAQFNPVNNGAWTIHNEFKPPRALAKSGDLGARATFIDVNGDGYVDLVYSYTENGTQVNEVYLNGIPLQAQGCPQGWVPNGGNCNSWALPSGIVFTDVARGDLGCRFVDINGDGLPDIICSVQRYDPSSGTEPPINAKAYINNAPGGPCGSNSVPDPSGKWCQLLPNSYSLPAAFVFDFGTGQTLELGTQLIDLDGDRLPAIVAGYRDPLKQAQRCKVCGIYKNNGGMFAVSSSGNLPVDANSNPLMLDAEYYAAPTDGYQISFMDIDGDGLPDMVQFIPAGPQGQPPAQAQVYLGNGITWDTFNPLWTITGDATNLNFGGTQFVDVNGDGRLDVIYNVQGGAAGVRLNTGSGWTAQGQNSNLSPALSFISSSGDDLGVRLIDVTGDGAPDQIQSTATLQQAYKNPGRRAGMLNFVKESSGVTTSYLYKSLVQFATYVPSTPDNTTPGIPLVPFSPLVLQSITDESTGRRLTTTYDYEGFRFDLSNSIALGFARIKHTDEAADTPAFSISHVTWFKQEPHLVGHPRLEQTIVNEDENTTIVDEITKTWKERHVNVVLNGTAEPGYLQLLLEQSVSKTFDLSGSGNIASNIETTFTYDDWLNATTVQVTKPGRAIQSLVNTYVDQNLTNYLNSVYLRYGRLTKSTSDVQDQNGATVNERTSTFTYFNDVSDPRRFLLHTETIDVGDDQLNSTTTYERDDRGNIASTTKKAANYVRRNRSSAQARQLNNASRRETFQYDQQLLRYIVYRTNAKNQPTSLDYQSNSIGGSLALPTRSTDPNQLVSINTYDGLGRAASQLTPDKVAHRFDRYQSQQIPVEWLAGIDSTASITVPPQSVPCASVGSTLTWTQQSIGFAEAERVTGSNKASRLASVKIYDARNRVIRTVNSRTDGSSARLSFTDSKYDTQGRFVAQSLPYFSGDKPHWIVYNYDALGRRTQTVRPDGAISRLCYDVTNQGLQETFVDARNNATVVQLNLDGKPLQITRADNGVFSLSYDAMGRVKGVRSPSGVKTTLDFDGLGNRKLLNDPNAGLIEYSYDAFGQLREERSGSQQWIQLDYDELGRKIDEWRYDQETTWIYDKSGTCGAIGHIEAVRLATQNSPTDLTYVENYCYDGYARLSRTLTKLDAKTAARPSLNTQYSGTYSFFYDPYSVLARVVYPTSISASGPLLEIKRQYDDATGQLKEVDDVTNGNHRQLWMLKSADASGRTQRANFGNGTHETKTFDPATNRITSFSVTSSAGKALSTENYTYDPVGNLLSRLIDSNDLEKFAYDEQNRLTSFDRARHVVSVTYDSDDRIRSKSGVGEYHYFSDADADKHCRSGAGSAPDALCAVGNDQDTTDTFAYDEFGNIKSHDLSGWDQRNIVVDYTYDHHVAGLAVGSVLHGTATAQFYYGPSGQRILSREKNGSRFKETVHLGLYDRISVVSSARKEVTDRFYVLGDQSVFLTVDATNRGHGTRPGSLHTTALYQHHDRLGSVVLLTEDDGRIGTRVHYDPWGKPSGKFDAGLDHDTGLDIEAAWTRGFTGQDHIPDFELIHMTGRVYDPRLGIFLSVDPLGGQSRTGGDLNPYLYAEGNPLAITDPTGLWGLSDIGNAIGNAISGIGQAIGSALSSAASAVSSALQNAAQWVGQNWREIASVAVIAVVTFATAGTGTGPVVAAVLAGAAGDATEAALYGGSVQDVIGAAVEGAVFGGLSAGLANAGLSWEASEFTHGFVGGVQSAMGGQNFTSGFLIGALSQISGSSIAVSYTSGWSVAEQVALSAVVNGVVSEAQGDKFANGALTGAFQQLYLDADEGQWQIKSVIDVVDVLASSVQPGLGIGGVLGAVGSIQGSVSSTTVSFISGYPEVSSFLNILQTGANDLTQLETAVEALKPKPPSPDLFSSGFVF